MEKKTKRRVLTYHGATHRNSSINRLLEVISGTVGLETGSSCLHELVIVAQAGSVTETA